MRNHHEELIAAPALLAGLSWLWTRIGATTKKGGKQ